MIAALSQAPFQTDASNFINEEDEVGTSTKGSKKDWASLGLEPNPDPKIFNHNELTMTHLPNFPVLVSSINQQTPILFHNREEFIKFKHIFPQFVHFSIRNF